MNNLSSLFHTPDWMRNILVRVLFVTVLCFPGCGYQFNVEGPGPAIGKASVPVQEGPPVRLAIRSLENRTFEPNLEYKFTDYLRQEFLLGSGAEVVPNEREADFLLKGAIESVTVPSITFTQTQTREGRVIANVKVEVKERKTGKILWVKSASGTAEYFIGESPNTGGGTAGLQFNKVLQDRAIEQAGQIIAEELAGSFWIARDIGTFSGTSKTKQKGRTTEDLPEEREHDGSNVPVP